MIIEVDEVKIQEMEEDNANLVKLIKRYDEAIIIKDELIRRYEKELSYSNQIILTLLDAVKNNFGEDEVKKAEIEKLIEGLESNKDGF